MRRESLERIIQAWMRSSMLDGGLGRYDDLHIDQIDPELRSRDTWIRGGLEAYEVGLMLRDADHLKVTMALAFSLAAGVEPVGLDVTAVEQLAEQLDWSPPSLYLFRVGREPWRLVNDSEPPGAIPHDFALRTVDATRLFGRNVTHVGCYCIEFRATREDEYSRTLFLAG